VTAVRKIRAFNDAAVRLLSHPYAVAAWWVASAGSVAWSVVAISMVAITMALSFLALAYGSAIAERQLRTEGLDHARDDALHKKIDELIHSVPEANDDLAGCEPVEGQPLDSGSKSNIGLQS
jgi:low affinity Fe/Cu permease